MAKKFFGFPNRKFSLQALENPAFFNFFHFLYGNTELSENAFKENAFEET